MLQADMPVQWNSICDMISSAKDQDSVLQTLCLLANGDENEAEFQSDDKNEGEDMSSSGALLRLITSRDWVQIESMATLLHNLK